MSEIELHRKLLGDAVRNRALHAALHALIKPGVTRVVDVGAGTGFISFLARQLGAAHCTLIEYSGLLEISRELARSNRIDHLGFVKAHSSTVRGKLAADLVICETLGNFALEEGLLETVVDAWRFLAPGGTVVPAGLRQFVAPVVAPRLQAQIDIWPQVGFGLDLQAAREVSLNNMYVRTLTPADLGGSDRLAQQWDRISFRPSRRAPSSLRRARLRWPAADLGAQVFGFALWWEAELVPGVTISTSPFAPPTHWEQIYLPLLRPLPASGRDAIELNLVCDTRPDAGLRVAWQTRHLRGGRALDVQEQDIRRGRI